MERPGASGLSWGVLARFADYVRDSGGLITASDGAVIYGKGMPSWPLLDRSGFANGEGTLRFGGSVRFLAHFGALDVPVAAPELHVADGRGVLRVAAAGIPESRIALAEFAWVDAAPATGVPAWVGREVTLASEAVPLFGGNYAAGMAMDPLIVVLA